MDQEKEKRLFQLSRESFYLIFYFQSQSLSTNRAGFLYFAFHLSEENKKGISCLGFHILSE